MKGGNVVIFFVPGLYYLKKIEIDTFSRKKYPVLKGLATFFNSEKTFYAGNRIRNPIMIKNCITVLHFILKSWMKIGIYLSIDSHS